MTVVLKTRKFLNVGGCSKTFPVPTYFDGWEHVLLDIDPTLNPDIVCDARELETLDSDQFDAVYCSHNLEHYYHHEVPKVLQGFRHVLKPSGFAIISVPDLESVMRRVVEQGLDIDDVLYEQGDGIPILVRDVFYGWEFQMKKVGRADFYAHRTGFTPKSLNVILKQNEFRYVFAQCPTFNIITVAFMRKPAKWAQELLGLTA